MPKPHPYHNLHLIPNCGDQWKSVIDNLSTQWHRDMCTHSQAGCSFAAVLYVPRVVCKAARGRMCLCLICSGRGWRNEVTEEGDSEEELFALSLLFPYCSHCFQGTVLKNAQQDQHVYCSQSTLPALPFSLCGCVMYAKFAQPLHQPPL